MSKKPPTINKPILYMIYAWQILATVFLAYSVLVPTAPEGIENIAMFGIYSVILFQLLGACTFTLVLLITAVIFNDPELKENYIKEQLKSEKTSSFAKYMLNTSNLVAIGLLIWTGSLFTAGLFTFFFLVNVILITIYKKIMKKATDEFLDTATEVLEEVVDS